MKELFLQLSKQKEPLLFCTCSSVQFTLDNKAKVFVFYLALTTPFSTTLFREEMKDFEIIMIKTIATFLEQIQSFPWAKLFDFSSLPFIAVRHTLCAPSMIKQEINKEYRFLYLLLYKTFLFSLISIFLSFTSCVTHFFQLKTTRLSDAHWIWQTGRQRCPWTYWKFWLFYFFKCYRIWTDNRGAFYSCIFKQMCAHTNHFQSVKQTAGCLKKIKITRFHAEEQFYFILFFWRRMQINVLEV